MKQDAYVRSFHAIAGRAIDEQLLEAHYPREPRRASQALHLARSVLSYRPAWLPYGTVASPRTVPTAEMFAVGGVC